MKSQGILLLGLLFAIIIALFAVFNVDDVPVNYGVGEAHWPLIIVILGSALLGALISGLFSLFRSIQMRREVKTLKRLITDKEGIIASQQNEIAMLQKSPELTNELLAGEKESQL